MRTKLIVEFAKLDPEAMMPTQGSPQAAGWDLYALDEIVIKRNISSLIRTGLAVAIPEGWEGQLRCRSSLGKKGMIMPNGIGTIDSDYRGEIGVILVNLSNQVFTINRGDRIAQLVLTKYEKINWKIIKELPETNRGIGGFCLLYTSDAADD